MYVSTEIPRDTWTPIFIREFLDGPYAFLYVPRMPRGGFSKAARNRRWRAIYGKVATAGKFKGQVYTYRVIAAEYKVSPMTVWAALNNERLPKRVPSEREPVRPVSVRIGLTRPEYVALKTEAKARKHSMGGVTRDALFMRAPGISLPESLPNEPALGGEA